MDIREKCLSRRNIFQEMKLYSPENIRTNKKGIFPS